MHHEQIAQLENCLSDRSARLADHRRFAGSAEVRREDAKMKAEMSDGSG
jgi:hypothetical protein